MTETKTHHHGASAQSVASYTAKYTPKAMHWLEPSETVSISMVEHKVTADGHHMVYRRDTDFAGSMAEAIKVLGF